MPNNNTLLNRYLSTPHICQSEAWGEFKSRMGNRAIKTGKAQFTIHNIPLLPFRIGYSPRPTLKKIDWEELYKKGKNSKCLYIKLDVPHCSKAREMFESAGKYANRLHKADSVFASETILMDLTASEDNLMENMESKTRSNIQEAWKQGVIIEEKHDKQTLEKFINLQKKTARRQGFYIHTDEYYKTLWDVLKPYDMIHLLIAKLPTEQIVAAYILFEYKNVFYYPYGASDYQYRSFMPNNLLMWETIKLGKRRNCKIFDMWGATSNKEDDWWGFTRFKLGFGGGLVSLPKTYDFVLNRAMYPAVTTANKVRWILLRLRKSILPKTETE